MTVTFFINIKAKQLAFYLRAYWQGRIPYRELDHFFWDTLEEWTQVKTDEAEPCSHKERVFWHLLHQIHFWSDGKLDTDPYLKDELNTCLCYIEGKGLYPIDCIGIRP